MWPSAIKDVVTSFVPEVSGELLITLDSPGPQVDPPLHIKVEAAATIADTSGLARRIEQSLREKLIFSAKVDLVPNGELPRTEMKAKLIERTYESARQ